MMRTAGQSGGRCKVDFARSRRNRLRGVCGLLGLLLSGVTSVRAAGDELICDGRHPHVGAGVAITVAPGAGGDGECFFLESSRPAAAVAAATHDEGDASP